MRICSLLLGILTLCCWQSAEAGNEWCMSARLPFQLDVAGLVVSTNNISQDGMLYYWTFGDGSVSSAVNPVHAYGQCATFPVALRASGDNSMMDLLEREAVLGSCPSFIAKAKIELGRLANDDKFNLSRPLSLRRNQQWLPSSEGRCPA